MEAVARQLAQCVPPPRSRYLSKARLLLFTRGLAAAIRRGSHEAVEPARA
jgi:hypothetical protein